MSNVTTEKKLFILAAALEAGCAELTVRRSVQMQKIKAELEIINGKPTWVIDRQSFDNWAAKRKANTQICPEKFLLSDGLDSYLDSRVATVSDEIAAMEAEAHNG